MKYNTQEIPSAFKKLKIDSGHGKYILLGRSLSPLSVSVLMLNYFGNNFTHTYIVKTYIFINSFVINHVEMYLHIHNYTTIIYSMLNLNVYKQ